MNDNDQLSKEQLLSIDLKNIKNPVVKDFIVEMTKTNASSIEEQKIKNPLSVLLSQQKRTNRRIVNHQSGNHMISFPMYWFKKWKTRYIFIELKEDIKENTKSIFVYTCDKFKSNSKILKVGETHYVKISDDIMQELNYPQNMELNFYDEYLEILVNDKELENIRKRKDEIKLKKTNEKMKKVYSRRI